MAGKPASLQDRFLNSARKSKAPVTLFLLKGVKLQGVITWFDPYSLLLRRDGQSQLVYKHSVSTVMPTRSLDLGEMNPPETSMIAALQDTFLSAAAREHQRMTVFLVNGVMLQGEVSVHDQFCLLLERAGQVQLVYKHAISTIQPEDALSLGGTPSDEPADE
ncbi:MAG TPA: RNA chaperone Hfq [Sphingomicrobium sp.]|nr:RNA chaperone Hfq [Sphingomicrobium sp.]